MVRTGGVWALLVIIGVCSVAARQSKPAFEIASVRRQLEPRPLRALGTGVKPGGVFNLTHATVQSLAMFAYDLKPHQIVGSPEWTRRDNFHIDARAGFDASADQVKQMVRSLLETRFKLVARREQRVMQYLAMVVARSDGRLGPYLRKLPDDCSPAMAADARKQFPPRPSTEGPLTYGQCMTVSGMVDLLSALATMSASVPIVDETGLSGKFVYELRAESMIPGAVASGSSDPSLPSFTVALEEQLGLKLESQRAEVPVLVIDSVERPSEN